jgi:cytochrome c oxidase subunit 2
MTIRTLLAPVLALLALSIAGPAWSDFELNMPVGVTSTSREVYELHMLILWVCVVIGAGVYAAMIAAIIRFRKSNGAVPAKFTHNATIEVVWTVIPAAILVAMAIPAAETLIRMEDTRNSELTVKVTGYRRPKGSDFLRGCAERTGN